MTLAQRFSDLSSFWKIYIFMVAAVAFVIAFSLFFVDPLTKRILFEAPLDMAVDWREAPVWAINILILSFFCAWVASKAVVIRMGTLTKAAKALSHGNFAVRVPVSGTAKSEFNALLRVFNEMAEAVERQMHNERRLLADISHELRSPMARMAVAIELLENKRGEEERAALVKRLAKELQQMDQLISLVLFQARERAMGSENTRPVELNGIIRTVVDDSLFQGEGQGKTVEANMAEGLTVYGNAVLLQSLIGNIVSNAVFYTPPGGRVLVRARHEGENIVITVRDFGQGVPEKLLGDIFRAFYRVDSSRARTSGGAGLGLALAREISLYHSGDIAARNVSPGLEITVTLPAYIPELWA